MRKFLIIAVVSAAILGSMVATVFAAPITLNWGNEVNPGKCDKVGKPVINVVQKIVNDVDSGLGGYWAFDHTTRHIQVWATNTTDEYCAVVQYEGKFDAQEGQASPGNTGTLDGDEDGAFQGGYRATINGTLKTSPNWATRGSVGTTDYDCDLTANCPGYVNWVEQYFDGGYSFAYEWWGWIYHAGKHGTWVNSSDGNTGDIN